MNQTSVQSPRSKPRSKKLLCATKFFFKDTYFNQTHFWLHLCSTKMTCEHWEGLTWTGQPSDIYMESLMKRIHVKGHSLGSTYANTKMLILPYYSIWICTLLCLDAILWNTWFLLFCLQCRTDKIVFKLFNKVPSDLPPVLRSQVNYAFSQRAARKYILNLTLKILIYQILGWLSSSPTDIESHIRPGCIILTVYLRLVESAWQEVCFLSEFSCQNSAFLVWLLMVFSTAFWEYEPASG